MSYTENDNAECGMHGRESEFYADKEDRKQMTLEVKKSKLHLSGMRFCNYLHCSDIVLIFIVIFAIHGIKALVGPNDLNQIVSSIPG